MAEIYKKEFKDIWLKAAVLGSLWGSTEIIIGSFFHNIRFPMAGTVLAVLGVSLMTAFGRNWKEKGLFWRAGLICAIMKSISPSAVLIGPMTGIFTEALIFELSVRLFGRNYLGFIVGGMIALYSVIVHKITSLLIIYGFDLVKILDNLYAFIIKQLNIQNLSFTEAFLLISSIYLILGLIASAFGIYAGNKAVKTNAEDVPKNELNFEGKKDMFSLQDNSGSVLILFTHLLIIVLCMVLINKLSVYFASILIVLYVSFVLITYNRAVRFLKRPWFWIQIALFVFISAVFFNGFNRFDLFTSEGLTAGIKMGVRAILIVFGFTAVSTELRNPFIQLFLYRKGFSQFYTASGLAFSVLPYIIKRSANARSMLRNPVKTLISAIHDAEYFLNEFKKMKFNSEVIIVTGEKHQGKTTFTEKLIDRLKKSNTVIKGFTAPGRFEKGKRTEFMIRDVCSGESKQLCGIHGKKGQKHIGRFYFNEIGLDFGKQILSNINAENTDFAVIDEVGPFELKGSGWSASINTLLTTKDVTMIWTVRKSLVYDIIRRFGVTDALLIDIEKDTPKSAAEILLKKFPPKRGFNSIG